MLDSVSQSKHTEGQGQSESSPLKSPALVWCSNTLRLAPGDLSSHHLQLHSIFLSDPHPVHNELLYPGNTLSHSSLI